MKKTVFTCICCLAFLLVSYGPPIADSHAQQQQKMVKILVSSPYITDKAYRPFADVFAGIIIRELNRNGGLEIIDREKSEALLKKKGLPEGIGDRNLALEVGTELGADIVIFSGLSKSYQYIKYNIVFLEVGRDIVQRALNGSFTESVSPEEISRMVEKDVDKMVTYIPLPSELTNPGLALRENTVNPEALPKSSRIDLPRVDRFGLVEQVFSYYRVFPGEMEYVKINSGEDFSRNMNINPEEDLDQELVAIMNRLQMYGEFALRFNFQAYLVKNCSVRAVNVFLANKIPVFYSDDGQSVSVLNGYYGLRKDGVSVFTNSFRDEFDSFDLIHRKLICVLVILPKPGKKGGISREYLDTAISRYQNDWGKVPTLVEIKEGFLDIISSGQEN
jgi:hypothetical protein